MTDSERWILVPGAATLADGDMLWVDAGRLGVALYRAGDRWLATQGYCTHGKARLSDGLFDPDSCIVECPLHSGRFEVTTGTVVDGPPTVALQLIEVRVEDGMVYVQAF